MLPHYLKETELTDFEKCRGLIFAVLRASKMTRLLLDLKMSELK